jgi:hypothetical protein
MRCDAMRRSLLEVGLDLLERDRQAARRPVHKNRGVCSVCVCMCLVNSRLRCCACIVQGARRILYNLDLDGRLVKVRLI